MQAINPSPSLTGSHLRTHEKIFQHPAAHNLPWRDVLTLFNHLGEIILEPNGHLKVTRNGHILILPAPRTKEVAEVEELMKLRHFLEQSETAASESVQPTDLMLVVIDHKYARLFHPELTEAAPQLILRREPGDYLRQAHESRDYFSGKEKPAPNDFFDSVAKALKGAGKVLIFGTGTGASNEMYQFIVWLKKHHSDLARRIIGTQVVDEHHLTDAQFLAKAREYNESLREA